MKVVILCGGRGSRLREETEFRPKPLIPIGQKPILWHIMKSYSQYNHNEFILALGYKGDLIKEYFMHYRWKISDFTLNIRKHDIKYHDYLALEDWNITFADTGLESMTAKRLAKLKRYLTDEDNFMLTYGDGVSDIDIDKLVAFHKEKGRIVTITGYNPTSAYGVIEVKDGIAKEFKEKPESQDIINGGFMVLNKKIFDYVSEENDVMLVETVLPQLAKEGQVATYHHKGFWHSMDTYRDYLKLNKMWDEKKSPWKTWKD
ncbi:MAG: glucose-1-phosphate cytidylyltransferase [DPANN group archaeon]|nr:glucose-1-phosphate cytidylyltransferase [DPANN group archaeon]